MEKNHKVVFHVLPLGSFIICLPDHNILKLIAFTSSHQPPANADDFASCYIIKANSTSDKVLSRGKLWVFEVHFRLPVQEKGL